MRQFDLRAGRTRVLPRSGMRHGPKRISPFRPRELSPFPRRGAFSIFSARAEAGYQPWISSGEHASIRVLDGRTCVNSGSAASEEEEAGTASKKRGSTRPNPSESPSRAKKEEVRLPEKEKARPGASIPANEPPNMRQFDLRAGRTGVHPLSGMRHDPKRISPFRPRELSLFRRCGAFSISSARAEAGYQPRLPTGEHTSIRVLDRRTCVNSSSAASEKEEAGTASEKEEVRPRPLGQPLPKKEQARPGAPERRKRPHLEKKRKYASPPLQEPVPSEKRGSTPPEKRASSPRRVNSNHGAAEHASIRSPGRPDRSPSALREAARPEADFSLSPA